MAGNIEELLELLYTEIEEAKSPAFNADKCVVDRDRVLDMIDDVKAEIPVEVKRAQDLVANRNDYIASAKREADEIREKFFVRIGEIFQTLTTEVMIAQLDECVAQIEVEMPMHFQRWAGYADTRIINSDSPSSASGLLRYWRQRVDRLKNVMTLRPYKFWGLFQDEFKLSNQQMEQYFGPRPADPEAK